MNKQARVHARVAKSLSRDLVCAAARRVHYKILTWGARWLCDLGIGGSLDGIVRVHDLETSWC